MSAIPAEERAVQQRLVRRLMAEVAEIRQLPKGFAFYFLADHYDPVTEFVRRERLCCPFLTLTLEVMPEQGPLILRLTGPAGVKDFIRAELGF